MTNALTQWPWPTRGIDGDACTTLVNSVARIEDIREHEKGVSTPCTTIHWCTKEDRERLCNDILAALANGTGTVFTTTGADGIPLEIPLEIPLTIIFTWEGWDESVYFVMDRRDIRCISRDELLKKARELLVWEEHINIILPQIMADDSQDHFIRLEEEEEKKAEQEARRRIEEMSEESIIQWYLEDLRASGELMDMFPRYIFDN